MSRRSLRPLFLLVALPALIAAWAYTSCPLAVRVIDAETGQPVGAASVEVRGRKLSSESGGEFRLTGLRELGPICVQAPGYRELTATLGLASVALAGDGQVFALEPTELEVRVAEAASGRPIPGATVRVGQQEAPTDADGRCLIKRVKPGDAITALAPDRLPSEPIPYEGQATQDISLSFLPVTVKVCDLCTGQPIAGALVTGAGQPRMSDAEGTVSLTPIEAPARLEISREGYSPARGEVRPGGSLALELVPEAVSGVVRDTAGRPIAQALVLARVPGEPEPRVAYTDADGIYRLEGLRPGTTLVVRKAGFRRLERPLDTDSCHHAQLEPFVAKGIYLAFHMLTPQYGAELQRNLELVDRTELNAIVIEIKTETGYLGFEPKLALAREIGAGSTDVIDVRALLADCRRRGIYTIARIPVFEDDLLAMQRPEWAIHRPDGSIWRAAGGRAWVDPFRQEVWDYNVAIAGEAVELGFDEVQFDYVRFPSDGTVWDCRYVRPSTAQTRVEAITGFIAHARRELDRTGAFLSVDLFGLTTFDPEEKGIGQLIERIAPHVDYVSPMLYPSTYLRGMLDLDDPWRTPYEVVRRSLQAAHQRTPALIRPWLQHFDDYHGLGITYGVEEVRLQKQAAADGGSWGWLFWNILGEYDPAAFEGE